MSRTMETVAQGIANLRDAIGARQSKGMTRTSCDHRRRGGPSSDPIGFAPTYAAIGVAAPLIIVLARLLQGLATGGEFASATSFLIESAPANRRGSGQGLSVLIGALLGALITRTLRPEALDSWGWRIPFPLGLIIGPVGLFIRRHLQETEAFLEASGGASGRPHFGTTLAAHAKQILVCMGIVTSGTISFYVILLFMPTFARVQLHLPLDQAFLAQAISLACMIVITPLSGFLSDFIGRKPIMIAALALYFVLVYPLFHWLHDNPSFGSLATVQNVMIFGGFAQFFVTWLIEATGSPIAPSFYVMFGAARRLFTSLTAPGMHVWKVLKAFRARYCRSVHRLFDC